MNNQPNTRVSEVAEKLSIALSSPDLPEKARELLTSVIEWEACEAGTSLTEPEIIQVSFPVIVRQLEENKAGSGSDLTATIDTLLQQQAGEILIKHFMKVTANLSAESESFAESVLQAEGQQRVVLASHFAAEMRKALEHGRVCTPERMILLYPIFREINIEADELRAEMEEGEAQPEEKPCVLDLSSQPENLDITAEQFSKLINQENLPAEYQSVLDAYCDE